MLPSFGPLAHREEQGTFNPKVPGSRPGRPTKFLVRGLKSNLSDSNDETLEALAIGIEGSLIEGKNRPKDDSKIERTSF